MAKEERHIRVSFKILGESARHEYLKALKKHLKTESGRFVSYQEVFEHLIDVMRENSNLPLDS